MSVVGEVHRFVPGAAGAAPTLLVLHGTGGDENDLLAERDTACSLARSPGQAPGSPERRADPSVRSAVLACARDARSLPHGSPWQPAHSSTRRRSWALMPTMTVLSDIRIAATAGLNA